jgi:hypothetical protein
MRQFFVLLCGGILFLSPVVALAQLSGPLVPCDGAAGMRDKDGNPTAERDGKTLVECQACHAVQLGQRIVNFIVSVAAFVAVGMFSWAGFLMLTAAGDTGKVSSARNIFTDVAVGFVIVLAGWLIIDTVMKLAFEGSPLSNEFASKTKFGPWNSVGPCVLQPPIRPPGTGSSNTNAKEVIPVTAPITGGNLTSNELRAKIAKTQPYAEQLAKICAAEKLRDCANAQAIMAIESTGDAKALSKKHAVGLMQVLPDTAVGLDPSLKGLSPEQIVERLKDPTYSMTLGVRNLAQLEKKYDGNLTQMAAAYNGGDKANRCGDDCQRVCGRGAAWQCAAIVPNNYGETRKFVPNVLNARKLIPV